MKKLIALVVVVLLCVGCGPDTLEKKMKGNWILVEASLTIENSDSYYENVFTYDVVSKNRTEKTRRDPKDEFSVSTGIEGRDYIKVYEFRDATYSYLDPFSDNYFVYDIEYLDNQIRDCLNEEESKLNINISNADDISTYDVIFEDDKMIWTSHIESNNGSVTGKLIFVKKK